MPFFSSRKFRNTLRVFKDTFKAWNDADPWRESAVIAYYAIFSLPALLVIVIALAGSFFGAEAVTGQLSAQISKMMGAETALQIEEMIANAAISGKTFLATAIAVVTLIAGATGVFVQLQKSFNMIWAVKPSPRKKLLKFLKTRLLSFGMVLSFGFLMLISLVITSMVAFLSDWLKAQLPDVAVFLIQAANFIVSFGLMTVLFALMFKFMPDAKINWKDVWVGSIVTSLLFSLGKLALGLYFGKAEPASTYGAAGSIVLILLWISYSCMILFFGAEFTRQYAMVRGKKIIPTDLGERDPKASIKRKG